MPKVNDPRKFIFPYSIAGVNFKKALYDFGSSVNLVSKKIVDKLSILIVELTTWMTLVFTNSSTTVPYGTIHNLLVQEADCILHTEFQVVKMSKDYEMILILGRPFMDIVGAIIDMPNKRVSFFNINKKFFARLSPLHFPHYMLIASQRFVKKR